MAANEDPFAKFATPTAAAEPADDPFAQFAAAPKVQAQPTKPVAERSILQKAAESLIPMKDDGAYTRSEFVGDTAANLKTGAANILGSTGTFVDKAVNFLSAGSIDLGYTVEAAQGALQSAVNGTKAERGPGITGAYADLQTGIDEGKSDNLRTAEQELADTKGALASAKKVISEPLLIAKFAEEQVANIATLGMGTRGTFAQGAKQALAKGAAPETAIAVGQQAAAKQIAISEGIQEGGGAAQQAEGEVKSMSLEQLATVPAFREMVEAGVTPEAARANLASNAGMIALPVGYIAGVLGGKISAPLESKIFTGGLSPKGLKELISKAGARTLTTTIAKEALEEVVQEGGAQIGQNLGIQQTVDPARTLGEGVPEAAAIGGTVGAIIGGGMGAAGIATSKPAGPLARVAQASQQQATGYSAQATAAMEQARAAAGFPVEDEAKLRAAIDDPKSTPEARKKALETLQKQLDAEGRLLAGPDGFTVAPDGTTTKGIPSLKPEIAKGMRPTGPFGPGLDQQAPDAAAREAAPTVSAEPVPAPQTAQEPAAEPAAAAPAPAPEPQFDLTPTKLDTDRLTKAGVPFSSRRQANVIANREGGKSVEVDGGWVVRYPTTTTGDTDVRSEAPSQAAEVAAQADQAPQGDEAADGGQASADAPISTAEGGGVPSDPDGAVTAITEAAHEAATSGFNERPEPTQAQKEAGNYKKGHARIAGMDIAIENPAGSRRKPEFEPLQDHYGYIKGTVGKDKDHIDVFIGPKAEDTSLPVFVVDQRTASGAFDEHKVVLGAATQDEASQLYARNYGKGWKGGGRITEMTQEQFKAWKADPVATKKPAFRAALAQPPAAPPADVAPLTPPPNENQDWLRTFNNEQRVQLLKEVGVAPSARNVVVVWDALPAHAKAKLEAARKAGRMPTAPAAAESKSWAPDQPALRAKAKSIVLPFNKTGQGIPAAEVDVAEVEGGWVMRSGFWTGTTGGSGPFGATVYESEDAAREAGLDRIEKAMPKDESGGPMGKRAEAIRNWITANRSKKAAPPPAAAETDEQDTDRDQEIDDLLQSVGETVDSDYEVMRRWNKGDRFFALHEQDEGGTPTEVTSFEMLRAYAPDQLMSVTEANAEADTAARAAARKDDKLPDDPPAVEAETPPAKPPRAKKDDGKKAWQEKREAERQRIADLQVHESVIQAATDGTDVEAAIRAAAGDEAIEDAMVATIAKNAKRLAAEAEKQRNRDPAVYQSALAAAMVDSKTEPGTEQATAFKGGWDHALAGRTKSGLAQGDLLADSAAGYEAARVWMKKGEGKVWYEGKRTSKLENTGVDLRRWYEQQRDKLKADGGDAKKLWAQLQRLTVRGDLFPIKPAEGASPGVSRFLEHVREHTVTFPTYFSQAIERGQFRNANGYSPALYRSTGRNRYGESFDSQAIEVIEGIIGDSRGERRYEFRRGTAGTQLDPMTAEQGRELLLDIAKNYISDIEKLRSVLAPAMTAQEFGELGSSSKMDSSVKDRLFYSRKAYGTPNPFDTSRYSRGANIVANDTVPIQPTDTSTPLRRPRLDFITRAGHPQVREGDVTPQEFKERFGFADVGFGKWVGAKQDQDHLNYAYDAFADLARTLGIADKAMGLGGKLHFTIGALGRGKHAAHYADNQPSEGGPVRVINVTNTKGDGTVAHEWGHALDFHLRRSTNGTKVVKAIKNALIQNPQTEEMVRKRLDDFIIGDSHMTRTKGDYRDHSESGFDYIRRVGAGKTNFKHAADDLGEDYWGNDVEPWARAFEAYVYDKMLGGNASNDYLVSNWVAEGHATPKNNYRGTPYPEGAERIRFSEIFDALADSLRVDEAGDVTVDEAAFDEARPVTGMTDARWRDMRAEIFIDEAYLPARRKELTEARKQLLDEQTDKRLQREAELAATRQAEIDAALAAAAPAPPPTTEAVSEADLEAIFDQAAAELREEQQEELDAPTPGEAVAPSIPQSESVKALAAEAAKLGVKGLGEALTGLHELFGGNALRSFPGGIDEATYAKAKPHFEAALSHFKQAGKSVKDLFKFLIQSFGDGIRPYAIHFAREQGLGTQLSENDNASSTETADRDGADGDARPGAGAAPTTEGERPAGGRAGEPGGTDRPGLPDAGAEPRADEEAEQDAVPPRRGRRDAGKPPAAQSGDRAEPGVLVALKQPGSAPNFVAPPGSIERTGSWRETAERNVQIIELVNDLNATGRQPTLEDQALLARYTGWGAGEIRNPMFPGKATGNTLKPEIAAASHRSLVERLAAATTPEEQATILRSTQYAHYTPEEVVRGIWDAIGGMGFTGGKILEPGMGIGLFPILAPGEVMARSSYTGIEFDLMTAKIAAHLVPQESVIPADYTKQAVPKDYFDVAIGNPPFQNTAITDDPEYRRQKFMLHDYFFAKTIDRVRPGGLVVFVTSKGTMDKTTDKARAYLADRADLLGAIRLPQTAFAQNAGTEVVTDVLFLQKREPGTAAGGAKWMGLKNVAAGNFETLVNEYFADNPKMVLGDHALEGGAYRAHEYTVKPRAGESIKDAFAAAAALLPKGVYKEKTAAQSMLQATEDAIDRDFSAASRKESSVYVADDGTLRIVSQGSGVPITAVVKLTAKEIEWLKDYTQVRDAVKAAMHTQLTNGDWEPALKALNKSYKAFQKKHGRVLAFTRSEFTKVDKETGEESEVVTFRYKNKKLLRLDAESPLVERLDKITEDDQIVDGSFLTGRSIAAPVAPKIETVGDALAVSLDRIGRLDIANVAELAKVSEEIVIDTLGESIFRVPGGGWTMSDEYLSGNVKQKLAEAEIAAKGDPAYARNVKALVEVQPKPLGAKDVCVSLGMSWLPAEYVNEFSGEIGGATDFEYVPGSNLWKNKYGVARQDRSAGGTYATSKRSATELLDAILNGRQIRITYLDADKKTIFDAEGTAEALEAAKKIKELFRTWIWQDAKRADRVLATYNDEFNNLAPRVFDGRHLTLPGLTLKLQSMIYPHQKRAIWRQIQVGSTYIAHAVGAGKTLEMIIGGMEQKRLGLIRKPMYAVPNHMLQQFSNEFLEAYPAASILVADEKNFDPENRARFAAMAALNNPDAVIITHSALGLLQTQPESRRAALDEYLQDLESAIEEIGKDDRINRRRLEQQKENLERRIEGKAATGKDKVVTFEELGVDFLYVDEAHEFRKLDFVTNRGSMKGIDAAGSNKAADLYVKSQWLERQRPGRSMVMASGTPITNTMAELYTLERYMAGSYLREVGLHHFDAWAAQHGEEATSLEPNAAGKYENVTRFAKFVNLPDQMARTRRFMDVITMTQLGDLVKRPTLRGGIPKSEIVTRSPMLAEYMAGELSNRIDISKKWKPSPDQPGNPDPIINIITDGRLAAIDMRFVNPNLKDDPGSKLNLMIDRIIEQYQATKGNEYRDINGEVEATKGATQIVFSAVGFGEAVAKNRGFDLRGTITARLVAGGVPADHLAWMGDYNTHAKKEAMFKKMRLGQQSILFGSPKNMGTGLNIQKRLQYLHYLSPPWYPADVEQPHGRILRQGNQNPDVGIGWYATKGTYDSSQWAMVARKARFIEQALEGDVNIREVDDISEVNQYEMAAALAAGDERVIDLAKARGEVERLTRLEGAHHHAQSELRYQRTSSTNRIASLEGQLLRMKDTAETHRLPRSYGSLTVKLGDKALTEAAEINVALHKTIVESLGPKWSAADGEVNTLPLGMVMDEFPLTFTRSMRQRGAGRDRVEIRRGELVIKVGSIEYPFEYDGNSELLEAEWMAVPVSGFAQRIVNSVNRPSTDQPRTRADLDAARNVLEKIEAKLGAPFEYAQQLSEATAEVAQISAELETEGKAAPKEGVEANDLTDQGPPVAPNAPALEAAIREGRSRQRLDYLAGQIASARGMSEAKKLELLQQIEDAGTALGSQITKASREENKIRAFETSPEDFEKWRDILLQQKTVPAALKSMRPFASEAQRRMIDFLLSSGAVNGVPFEGMLNFETTGKMSGVHRYTRNKLNGRVEIMFSSDPGERDTPDPIYVLIHESIHAATSHAENRNPPVAEAMARLLAHARAEAVKLGIDPDSRYGLSETQEFIAEAMSNPDFQALLKKMPALKASLFKSTWDAFKGIVARVIGVPRSFNDTLLEEMMAAAFVMSEFVSNERAKIAGNVPLDMPQRIAALEAAEASEAVEVGGREARTLDAMGELMQPDPTLMERLKSKAEDWRPNWLGALTLKHLGELGAKLLPQIAAYDKVVVKMNSARNQLMDVTGKTADKWASLMAREPVETAAMVSLMHDSTIAGTDGSRPFIPGMTGTSRLGGNEEITPRSVKHRIDQLTKERALLDLNDHIERAHNLDAQIRNWNERLAQERVRRAAHPDLVARWTDLPAKQKELYLEVRKAYEDMSQETLDALVSRITKMEIGEGQKAALSDKMRAKFEEARLQGPYFPLSRFGDFWISSTDDKGEKAFFMYGSHREWKLAKKQLPKDGYTIDRAGRKIHNARQIDGASGGFIAEIEQILNAAGIDNDVKDEVYQLYLRTLPDLSTRKHFIHRKAVAGFSDDALRAFGGNMFHGAHQVARLANTDELDRQLTSMKKSIDAMTENDSDDAQRASALYNEMVKRHEWVMNPKDSAIASKIGALGFVYYLGVSPAAGLVNLTQTWVVALPTIGARYGFAATNRELLSTMALAGKHIIKGDLRAMLTPDEQLAYDTWIKSGLIDTTAAHALIGISETDSTEFNRTAHKAMEITSWAFHRTEVLNRQATALAAYRLARKAGVAHAEASEYASKATWDAHFDYSNANRARFMQSGTAKVLLQFRQYSLNMTWHLARNFQQGLLESDATPQEKAEARKKLAGTLGITALFSGALGLPMMSVVFGILNAVEAMMGDDDEPWDAEVAFQNWLAETLGKDVGQILTKGIGNGVFGIDLHSRTSLNNLWLREADQQLEGRDAYHYWLEQMAGPTGGMLSNLLRGKQLIQDGQIFRGIETMVPKFVKDGMRAVRYGKEGVNTLRGDPLIEDVSLAQALLQLSGFSPAELEERYDANRAAKNFEKEILKRRESLLDAYALAVRLGDWEAAEKVTAKIIKWNTSNPELGIDAKTIDRSMRSRARYSQSAADGITLNPKLRERALEQAEFAE